jgi:hypothetical protein
MHLPVYQGPSLVSVVQTGAGTQPASCPMDTGEILGTFTFLLSDTRYACIHSLLLIETIFIDSLKVIL